MSLVECRALECRALRPEPTLKPMQAQRSVVTLKLLESIEAISSSRDRDVLAMTVTAALHDFFAPRTLALYRLVHKDANLFLEEMARHDGQQVVLNLDDSDDEELNPIASLPLVEQSFRDGDPVLRESAEGFCCAFPLLLQNATTPYAFFVFEFAEEPPAEVREALGWILRFYGNYLSLLDYSELDTLTGLLNRKTFDEVFEKILAKLPAGESRQAMPERREERDSGSHWLAVVDLDHFKRINDTFGHLFGDEVLLRLGNLMRTTFRKHDLLFRFGGEEFVVVLRPNTPENAIAAFERFRAAVEAHEFPQVGQVTCSLGFTRVDPNMAPIDIVGRADKALYFAKENGRNQVCGYEMLIEQGLLEEKVEEQVETMSDVDIDALFG